MYMYKEYLLSFVSVLHGTALHCTALQLVSGISTASHWLDIYTTAIDITRPRPYCHNVHSL
ncbi:hypothetical protein BP00DRAFT_429668 [Aspergillus indologenus CBS 114.80]|uniref:Uncharacterized protein n=1 Tax=Aspergillus indologenus CBS 114.80 TaxID=1450541 RepID=A0A2V5ISZ7_9EURO|nr:hypothetical protein BP00DRAFT_429668 [Aspergillus indologenus CBS 114.80]